MCIPCGNTHAYSLWYDLFLGTIVKVVCKGQAYISKSHFLQKMVFIRSLVFHKHSLFGESWGGGGGGSEC